MQDNLQSDTLPYFCRTDEDLRDVMMKVEQRIDEGRIRMKKEVSRLSALSS